ncbi:MAG: phosphopantetheine-binding protein [Eubacteriales bacterium]
MVFDQIKDMLVERTGLEPAEVSEGTAFADLGLDSLDIAELLLGIEETFGVAIQASAEMQTVSDIVQKVEAAVAEKQKV